MTTKKFVSASEFFRKHHGPLSLGRFLHSFRTAHEITQTTMAATLGISKQELCDIEKERKLISIDRAILFAKKLKHSEAIFIKYTIDDHLRKAGSKLRVTFEEAA
jgi:DNA-binding XRE family transcriptional regulator